MPRCNSAIPQTFEAFAAQLQDWNRQVIESCSAKHPGEFKSEGTRAARFSRWLGIRSNDRAFAALKQSHALEQPATAQLAFDDLHIAQA